LTEEQLLVHRMRAGDQQAFDQFFEAFAARLGAFAARRSAMNPAAVEDVVQLTMINAMKNLAGFRGESSVFTWLCQICRNQLADIRRKAARQPALDSLEAVLAVTTSSTPVQLLDLRDPLDECLADSTRQAIRRALNGLAPRYGRILELRYGDDLSIAEIGQIMGLSDSAAQSLLTRARGAFRAEWHRDDQDAAVAPASRSIHERL
jgi:RNA polymerase sigma-70 factor (ECF subfamily)